MKMVISVKEGEALGLYNALVWVADLIMNNVDFHLDSKKLVDKSRERSRDITKFGTIMNVCRLLVNVCLQTLMSISVGDKWNTHELPKITLLLTSHQLLVDLPSCKVSPTHL